MTWIVDFEPYRNGSTYAPDYVALRAYEYKKAFGQSPEEQFGFIFKYGLDVWSSITQDIKDQIPKDINMEKI